MKQNLAILAMCLVSSALLSIPWLVPGCGFVALFAFIPLLFADAIVDQCGIRRFWLLYFTAFVVWNAATTFWVCNATVGGGIFAVLANAAQMTLVWAIFRFSKKKLNGFLPYLLLAAMWIAWERRYYFVDISWPWLTLGNAFARSTSLVQWYEYTGTMGGSLWVWCVNLGVFGLINAIGSGNWRKWNKAARSSAILSLVLVTAGPAALSLAMYAGYQEKSEGTVNVLIAQPNFDPYEKFESLTQAQQTAILVDQYESALDSLAENGCDEGNVLLLAPETFTGRVFLNDPNENQTVQTLAGLVREHPGSGVIMGASTYDIYDTHAAPSILARSYGDGWIESHNSALSVDETGVRDVYHKSKLVVGTELTPYPKIFVPLDNWLSKIMGVSGLMARDMGQKEISLLHFGDEPVGCAVCYESIYGEFCTGYVRKGARMMTVITNDAWWGDTPGYRQHLSYSRLRAIELRRDIARCGNTGISCFIDQKGDIVSNTSWWDRETLYGTVNLNSELTFFASHGDMVGRIGTFVFLLLLLLLVVKSVLPRR